VADPLPAPRALPPVPADVRAREAALPDLAALGIARNPRILKGGEPAARARLRRFVARHARGYARLRDRLDLDATSRLSQDLKFGTLSVRTIWNAVASPAFANELVWREFTHSTLWDRPELLDEPFRRDFIGFPWRDDETLWRAWTDGRTGYPIVDAAARQLLAEGFVHNRARMIAGQLPHQAPAHQLPPRRGPLHALPHRRRLGPEQRRLAMVGGLRLRCPALLPRLQPDDPGRDLRSHRRLRPSLAPRAGRRPRSLPPSPVGSTRRPAARLPRPHRRSSRGARPLPSPLAAAHLRRRR
jgi:hypothetical protein